MTKDVAPIEYPLTKYIIAGIAAAAVEYGSFYILYTHTDWRLYVSNSVSFLLALLTGFFINRLWSFSQMPYTKKLTHQFSIYTTLAIANLVLTILIVSWLSNVSIDPRLGKFIAMALTSLWNYVLFKYIIFRHV